MYPYLHRLLSDRTGGVIFRCFGPWHFFWIALTAAVFAALYLHLRSRERQAREKALGTLTDLCFGLYILDFFLMPLAPHFARCAAMRRRPSPSPSEMSAPAAPWVWMSTRPGITRAPCRLRASAGDSPAG